MKKIAILLIGIMPFAALAQKPIKPSTNNAEKALRAGQFDEAKAIIDATTSSDDFMLDKKGNPSKHAAKAWFLRGVIYAGIDTTKVAKYKSLVPEGFPIAKEAFEKAKALDKEEISFLKDATGILPMMNKDVNAYMAQAYFNTAIAAYQDEKDYKKAFAFTEKTLYFIPEDTAILMNAGVFFGPAAEEYDKSIEYIKKYQQMGGKSTDAYIMLFSIYRDKLKDNDKALALAQELVKKFPGNPEYPKFELDMYVKMNRLPEAKAVMEKQAAADPTDKESRYFLGVISNELGNPKEARKWFEESIKLDSKYFEPQLGLAEVIYIDAKNIKSEMNQLGNSKEDFKKKVELDKIYQEKLRVALPYWEKCEKLSPDDGKVLDNLYMIYNDLEMTAQVTRIEKRMKTLGLLD
ncbi:MAG: tetratricopeptide repeat protein [Cyclobacteriaceae bacterium]|nr:tetratricopeptide repeat protein [Cyclobacteriaceae bacterium]